MHISYYKKPCRHVRTCFREGRFLPLKYYSISHTTHAVFIAVRHCTTKCYSSTTLYYKVLVRYYSVLQSTSPAPAAAPAPATPASAQHQRQHQRQHQHQHQRQRQHQQHQDEHQHQQHQRHHQHRQNRNFTTVSGARHARSYERVALSMARSQFYYSFGRSTRTILRKGSSGR